MKSFVFEFYVLMIEIVANMLWKLAEVMTSLANSNQGILGHLQTSYGIKFSAGKRQFLAPIFGQLGQYYSEERS